MDDSDPSAILRIFGTHLEKGDYDGAAQLFTPDAVYEEPPRFRFQGRDSLRAFFREFAERHSNVSFIVRRTLADPAGALLAAEWRWAYTRDADGERRAFEGICFIDLVAGLITRWRGFSAISE